MEVRLIENKELLESVELFKIENLLWGTEKIAKTYGYIGFVPGEGLYIKLVCVEKNPLRIYKKDQDPVYKAALLGASLNVFINTKSMADKEYAASLNEKADKMIADYSKKADEIFAAVNARLR